MELPIWNKLNQTMVRERGLEPPRPKSGHQHLKLARLPIPPLAHVCAGMSPFRVNLINNIVLTEKVQVLGRRAEDTPPLCAHLLPEPRPTSTPLVPAPIVVSVQPALAKITSNQHAPFGARVKGRYHFVAHVGRHCRPQRRFGYCRDGFSLSQARLHQCRPALGSAQDDDCEAVIRASLGRQVPRPAGLLVRHQHNTSPHLMCVDRLFYVPQFDAFCKKLQRRPHLHLAGRPIPNIGVAVNRVG